MHPSYEVMDTLNISKLEQAVIDAVRKIRIERGWTQRDLSDYLEVSHGFVAKVESPKFRAKYNLQHIEKLSEILECSPKDFLPDKYL